MIKRLQTHPASNNQESLPQIIVNICIYITKKYIFTLAIMLTSVNEENKLHIAQTYGLIGVSLSIYFERHAIHSIHLLYDPSSS